MNIANMLGSGANTLPGGKTGTVPASSEAMLSDALPFRLQLASSTAPAPVAETFEVPATGSGFTSLDGSDGVELRSLAKAAPGSQGDSPAEDHTTEADDILALPLPGLHAPLPLPVKTFALPASATGASSLMPGATPMASIIPTATDPALAASAEPIDIEQGLTAPIGANPASADAAEDAFATVRPEPAARALPKTLQVGEPGEARTANRMPDVSAAPVDTLTKMPRDPQISASAIEGDTDTIPPLAQFAQGLGGRRTVAPSENTQRKPQPVGDVSFEATVENGGDDAPLLRDSAQPIVETRSSNATPTFAPGAAPALPSQPAGHTVQNSDPQPAATSAPLQLDQHFGERMSAAIGAAMGSMTLKDGMLRLQVTPDHLGPVEIEIDTTGQSERLQITVESDAVRQAVAQAQSRIEQDLRQAGTRLGTFDITLRDTGVDSGTGQSGHREADTANHRSSRDTAAPGTNAGQPDSAEAVSPERANSTAGQVRYA